MALNLVCKSTVVSTRRKEEGEADEPVVVDDGGNRGAERVHHRDGEGARLHVATLPWK